VQSVDCPKGRARYEATVPLGRSDQPDDLARPRPSLPRLGDAAMITGTCVEVDGGRCI
jgi:3-oxoacyl-[acyl-carrier protein] reductase